MARAIQYKDINLIAAMDRKHQRAKAEKATAVRLPILILVLVALLLGVAYYYLYTNTNELEEQKASINLFLNDPITQADYNESFRAQAEAERMITQASELERVLLNLSSYPDMYGGDFHLIYEYSGDRVEISGVNYTRTTGVLAFNAECVTVTGVPIFVSQLRMSGIFSDVKYEGYTERITTTTTQGTTVREWVPELGADGLPMVDAAGNEMGFWQETTPTTTREYKSYVFAVTALVNAPEPRLPGPGESVNGSGY